MNPYWIFTLLVGAAGAGCAVWLAVRLLSYRHASDARCGAEFSSERYLAMGQLLAREEVEFLASQPGVSKREIAEFEREQRAIFRSYLTELVADFQALHTRARQYAAVAPEQQADLVGDLIKQQVSLWTTLTRLEIQLALAPLGVRVDARPLMDLVGALGRTAAATGPVAVHS